VVACGAARQHFLLAEIDRNIDPILHGQILRQVRHHIVDTLASGELLEGMEQVDGVLRRQVGNVWAFAVAVLAMAITAKYRTLTSCLVCLLAPLLVGHQVGEALHRLIVFVGTGESSEAAQQKTDEDAHVVVHNRGNDAAAGSVVGSEYKLRKRTEKWHKSINPFITALGGFITTSKSSSLRQQVTQAARIRLK